ncbi:MAG: N-acetylmannosamine-6-phosphate 2-epimerase [Bacillota bacterium]|nr:N-acetylmannosamine-6-phosphate 2-epimerase [Bacillota bacterium]
MKNKEILNKIKGGLIVSCQALENEPLYSSYIMSRMAYAAMLGGASGIRANTAQDIMEIKKAIPLPVIGICKAVYADSDVYITPTMKEVDSIVSSGAEIIAIDATMRLRPDGKILERFFKEVRSKYPDQIFMADTSAYEEGVFAEKIGFDLVGTTLSGYTDYTKGNELPDYELMKRYTENLKIPVIAEGGIWTPEQLKKCMDCGVWAAVAGTAITRPMEITKHFLKALE